MGVICDGESYNLTKSDLISVGHPTNVRFEYIPDLEFKLNSEEISMKGLVYAIFLKY